MKRSLLTLTVTVLSLAGCGGADHPSGPPPGNRVPNTPSISSTNVYVALLPDETVGLTATGTDPDGDPLSFTWDLTSGSGGVLSSASGTTNQWTAGPNPGTDQIRVTTSDGELQRTSLPLSLTVGTAVADTVANGEVWRADRDPYVLTRSMEVFQGYTLTIEPGVLVLLRKANVGGGPANIEFRVSGHLEAVGTATSPIFFRTGDLGNPGASAFSGLEFQLQGTAHLAFVRIDRAETGIWHRSSNEVSLFRCTITNSGAGIRLTNGSTARLRSTKIDNSTGDGLIAADAEATLRNCTISRSGGAGIRVAGLSALGVVTADSCILDENAGYNLVLAADSQAVIDSTNFIPAPGGKSVQFTAAGSLVPLMNCYWGISLEGTTQEELAAYLRPRAFTNADLRSYEVIPIRTTPWELPLAPP